MSQLKYDVYLDESGDFESESKSALSSPSLVGGLLIPSKCSSEAYANSLIPSAVHAMEEYDKALFFSVLKKLRDNNGHFLIFNNEERLNVVNGDMTYLNVLSEGLVQLMRNLKVEHPDDDIELNLLIATRQAVSYKEYIYGKNAGGYNIRIEQDQYYARLEEKLIISMGKNQVKDVQLKTTFGSATKEKRLMLADIICNTFYSKNSRRKFTDEDRRLIDELYEEQYIYSVFENATVGNLKRLFIESRYGEMLWQLCVLPGLQGVIAIRNSLLRQIANEPLKERDTYLSYMSLQISQYNNHRMFAEGIKFAENYKKVILYPLKDFELKQVSEAEKEAFKKQIDFWIFDTDFYVLTMYDHSGNPAKCAAYLKQCRENIGAISQSWEHVDYYMTFCIRELNCLIGQFAFEEVIEKTDKLLKILQDAKDLFSMIGAYDNMETVQRSELLGKVYGVRLEAFLNLLYGDQEYFSEALKASDAAISEFSDPEDLRRQYQYRCQLMVEAAEAEKSIACLFRSFGEINDQGRDYGKLVGMIYKNKKKPAIFSLFHYTNVMRILVETEHPDAKEMYKVLTTFPAFAEDLKSGERKGHPWNLIVWNMSRCCRALGKTTASETLYKYAMAITQANPDNVTLYTFSLSMSAEYLLYCTRNGLKTQKSAENEYRKACEVLHRHVLPEGIAVAFPLPGDKITEAELEQVSMKYLK